MTLKAQKGKCGMFRRRGGSTLARIGWITALSALISALGAGSAQAAPAGYHISNRSYPHICVGLQHSRGPNVVIGSCNPYSISQRWYRNAGPVRLRFGARTFRYYQYANRQYANGQTSRHRKLCLGVRSGSRTSGARLVVGRCHHASDHSQLWARVRWFGGRTVLINGHSGLCMGTQGGRLTGGTLVVQGNCYGTRTQNWTFR